MLIAPVKDKACLKTIWHFAGNGGMLSLVAISTALLLQSCFSLFSFKKLFHL